MQRIHFTMITKHIWYHKHDLLIVINLFQAEIQFLGNNSQLII